MKLITKDFVFKRVDPHETQLMEAIYKLRFEVYARQCKFIREEDYPKELEWDEYDTHSVHFAAINSDGVVVATTRLILNDQKSSPLLKWFPHISRQYNISPGSVAEISRLIICKKLRHAGPSTNRFKNLNESGLAAHSTIAKGLYRQIHQETKRRGITHVGALMERGLLGLLRIYGFRMQCVGDDVDLFGLVRPYIGAVTEMEKSLFLSSQLS